MTARWRWALVVGAAVLLIGGALAYGLSALERYQEQAAGAPVSTAPKLERVDAGQLVFRTTASGSDYGHVAAVPADDPGAAREVSAAVCDRVDATPDAVSCLRTVRGVVTTFEWDLLDASFDEQWSTPLPGIPSRTRISDDSRYQASTAFVTGHGYATIGFSTATTVVGSDGTDHGNLEEFAFTVNGEPFAAADRNFWGVTFVPGTDEFYATGASGQRTWLVHGDLGDRTLEAIHDGVECPSLSPDGTRIAFKQIVRTTPTTEWTVAVLDLATGRTIELPESRNVDDQVEWLDDETLLYGLPRVGSTGDYDVWSIAADGSSDPSLFLEHAWSPSVVR
ncbi:hypothetical protein [Agromyces sp. Leaf222]|uniref:hypothetical protein n=1 Tax=Agromyces sp. Leaf222 TaxID=1735688 RepID=UPI000AD90834|nr:hypothetical protein [Agromyces sp. Leaf222]